METHPRVIPPGTVIEQMFHAVHQEHGTDDDSTLAINIPMPQYRELYRAVKELESERDRARALAAKLEEVVAMRTTIVQALADRDPDERPEVVIGLQAWAKAQLSEIP